MQIAKTDFEQFTSQIAWLFLKVHQLVKDKNQGPATLNDEKDKHAKASDQ